MIQKKENLLFGGEKNVQRIIPYTHWGDTFALILLIDSEKKKKKNLLQLFLTKIAHKKNRYENNEGNSTRLRLCHEHHTYTSYMPRSFHQYKRWMCAFLFLCFSFSIYHSEYLVGHLWRVFVQTLSCVLEQIFRL